MKFDIIVRLEALKKLSVLDRDKDTIQDAIDTINSLREENESAWSMLEELKASDIKNYKKQILPNYKEFDEKRYFLKGEAHEVFEDKGLKFGISICEDIWNEDFTKEVCNQDIDLLINLSASPFTLDKKNLREEMLCNYFAKFKIPKKKLEQHLKNCKLIIDHDGAWKKYKLKNYHLSGDNGWI